MKTSLAMEEIRRIRDENSLRHMKQTKEERRKELEESTKWFFDEMEKLRVEDEGISKVV
jgi:hypothetical protein